MNRNSKGFSEIIIIIIFSLVVVGGIGYYSYKNGQIKLNPSQNKDISPTPDSTDNWKTYKNEDYKLEFMYPDYLKIANRGPGPHESVVDNIDFINTDNIQIFSLTIYSTKNTLSDFIKKNLNILFPPNMQKESSFETEHISADKYLYRENSPNLPISFIYFFSNQTNIFAFQISNANDEKVNIADQILSTFMFTDKSSPTPRQTPNSYTNNQVGFSINLPANWVAEPTQIIDGVPTAKIINSKKALNEVYIGSPLVYSTSGSICANQWCEDSTPFSITLEGKSHQVKVIKASTGINKSFNFYVFQFELGKEKPYITGRYTSSQYQQEIINLLSTFKLIK